MRRSGISEITGQSGQGEIAEDASGAESPAIRVTAEEMRVLEAWLAAPDTLQSVVRRASIIREAARGRSNSAIARKLAVGRATVILWRRRFAREGILSLSEVRPGRGRRRSVSTRTVRAIVEAARRGGTASGPAPSARHLAEQSGVSAATVYRLWDAHGVRLDALGATPDRSQERAAGALLGIYLDPPDRVIALRGGEPQPLLQCGVALRRALSGALDRFDRCAVGHGLPRDRERAFLKFLRHIERETSVEGAFVLVLDGAGATHARAAVRRWLEARPGAETRRASAEGSTATLLALTTEEVARPQRAIGSRALRRLLDDVRGYLSIYEGEPDRFIWLASPDAP
jgi:hypothetical protein